MKNPKIVVLAGTFPSAQNPVQGVFIKERMFRVAQCIPLIVLSPKAWSPLDWLIRIRRPSFRKHLLTHEVMDGIDVYRPRYFSIPGIRLPTDPAFQCASCLRLLRKLGIEPSLIDAHFLYPDGVVGHKIAKRLRIPFVITLRGRKDLKLLGSRQEPELRAALRAADQVLAVSSELKFDVGEALGIPPQKILESGNGVDCDKFYPVDRSKARRKLGLSDTDEVLISVGGLVAHKGFDRIIELLPVLLPDHPNLRLLIVGGATQYADVTTSLKNQVSRLNLSDHVIFCGQQSPQHLRWFYSAADLFVLATEYEGWANVLLEAMACGVPVVTTNVGGNANIVATDQVGELCPFWDKEEFAQAIDRGLRRDWNKEDIVAYARSNDWRIKIPTLVTELRRIINAV